MAEPNEALGRAIGDLTLQLSRAYSRKLRQYDELGLEEIHQQFQIDVTGTEAGWTFMDIPFDFPFSFSPTRRRSDLVYPHATFGVFNPIEDPDTGAALTPGSFTPTKLYPCITHFSRDPDTDQFTGARLFVEVEALSSDPDNPVAASIHVTFQGFASPSQSEEDL